MHQGNGPPQQGPPRFQNQGQWNGPPRMNGPRPGGPGGPGPMPHRPQMVNKPPYPSQRSQRFMDVNMSCTFFLIVQCFASFIGVSGSAIEFY